MNLEPFRQCGISGFSCYCNDSDYKMPISKIHIFCRLIDTDSFLYGVFDGHDGSKIAHFAAQRMPAELLLGQLNNNNTDDEIKDILYQVSNSLFYRCYVVPPLVEKGLYCNHLVRPSICLSVHTFVTDISASTGRNDCTSTSCLPCDLQMNEWGYS